VREHLTLATDSERRTPFDLRATIPLAKTTLISLARRPKRSWLIPFLTLFTGILLATMMLELLFAPGPLSALAFEGELRSRLLADYSADPLGIRIQGLRLTIMDEVLSGGGESGSGSGSESARLMAPVPTATPAETQEPTATSEVTAEATPIPVSATDTPAVPIPATATDTPLPAPAPTNPPGSLCDKLSIVSFGIHGDDKLRADVRNQAAIKAYLKDTTVEWPAVPPPAYVDWFEFNGNRYYSGNDFDSPTSKSGTSRELNAGKTWRWEADWDDLPAEGLYGSFHLTLVFKIATEFCTLDAGTFRSPPATPVPTGAPTDTPLPATATETSLPPTEAALPATVTPTPSPTETATITPTPG
jgi:hypothetical protein